MSESPTHARSWSLRDLLEGYVTAPHPPTPGAVAMIVVDGTVVEAACAGERVRYADRAGRLLPDSSREPMHPDDLFDLASVTKLFATITLLRLVDAGVVDLDGPLQAVLPSYAHGDKRQVTLRHLLTHTSGLPSITRLWDVPGGRDDRITALLDIPLEATPGARFAYSCVGYMTAMALAETVTGTRFDALVADHVTTPLGLAETLYNPLDHGIDVSRCAATEFDEEYRGRLVRGEVHDENAFSLDGVSANAGLFATAADLARFGEAVRTNGAADVPSSPRTRHAHSDVLRSAVRVAGPGVPPRSRLAHRRRQHHRPPGRPRGVLAQRVHRHVVDHPSRLRAHRRRVDQPGAPEPRLERDRRPPAIRRHLRTRPRRRTRAGRCHADRQRPDRADPDPWPTDCPSPGP